jgi:hypothetical protein
MRVPRASNIRVALRLWMLIVASPRMAKRAKTIPGPFRDQNYLLK